MKKNICIVFILTFIYSVLRYNIFGDIPVTDIPVFILNKTFAFSMIIILVFIFFTDKKSNDYNNYVIYFRIITLIHILMSISLLSPNYYPKIYETGKLTLFGNISILAGIVLSALMIITHTRIKNIVIYLIASIHLFFIGINGWINIEKWNGKMPPITLICFLILVVLIFFSIKKKKFDNLQDCHRSIE